ncbi:hypothetical protein ABT010_40330 [Streptomyces sp. NPDC002668]|uniref:hypothetical protein n=1 Tax=Streptomyces sp. NPDC002668 TaxID=3154422 RepID=UPI0033326D43
MCDLIQADVVIVLVRGERAQRLDGTDEGLRSLCLRRLQASDYGERQSGFSGLQLPCHDLQVYGHSRGGVLGFVQSCCLVAADLQCVCDETRGLQRIGQALELSCGLRRLLVAQSACRFQILLQAEMLYRSPNHRVGRNGSRLGRDARLFRHPAQHACGLRAEEAGDDAWMPLQFVGQLLPAPQLDRELRVRSRSSWSLSSIFVSLTSAVAIRTRYSDPKGRLPLMNSLTAFARLAAVNFL